MSQLPDQDKAKDAVPYACNELEKKMIPGRWKMKVNVVGVNVLENMGLSLNNELNTFPTLIA